MNNTIKELRQNGCKVKVEHYRNKGNQFIPYSRKTKGEVDNNGGITVVTLTKEGKTTKGVSTCHKIDQFNYRAGASIALQRALNELK